MKREEAIELLKNSWFISLDGKATAMDAEKALALTIDTLKANKALRARAKHCKDMRDAMEISMHGAQDIAKAIGEENKVLRRENEIIRAELKRLVEGGAHDGKAE